MRIELDREDVRKIATICGMSKPTMGGRCFREYVIRYRGMRFLVQTCDFSGAEVIESIEAYHEESIILLIDWSDVNLFGEIQVA